MSSGTDSLAQRFNEAHERSLRASGALFRLRTFAIDAELEHNTAREALGRIKSLRANGKPVPEALLNLAMSKLRTAEQALLLAQRAAEQVEWALSDAREVFDAAHDEALGISRRPADDREEAAP